MLLLTAALALALLSSTSAQTVRCGAAPNSDSSQIIVSCTFGVNPYTGPIYYAFGSVATTSDPSGVTPFSIDVQDVLNSGSMTLNLLLIIGVQQIRFPLQLNIQTTTTTNVGCAYQQNSTTLTLTCTEDGQPFTGAASYTINDDQARSISSFPLYILLSDFPLEINNLSVSLQLSDGRTSTQILVIEPRQTTVPTGFFRVRCRTSSGGSTISITCSEAQGSDTIASYNYTLNGILQGVGNRGDFPITINRSDLGLGTNYIVLGFTSTRGLSVAVSTEIVISRPFDVSCGGSVSGDDRYIEITCVLGAGSQTISGARYSINGVNRGVLEVTDSASPEFRISIETDSAVRQRAGEANNINLTLTGSGNSVAVVTLRIPVRVSLSAECGWMYVEGGRYLEVRCNRTGGNQEIESLSYSVNGGATTTVSGTSFRIEASLLNSLNNFVRVTITGSRGSVLTLPDISVSSPVSCPPVVNQATNEIVLTCVSGGSTIQASFEYTIQGQTFTGTTRTGQPIRINLGGVPSGEVIVLILRRADGTILAQQQITITMFSATCGGMYLDNGNLRITCTSPQDIARIEYRLNDNPSFIAVGQSSFVIPQAGLLTTTNTVELRVYGREGPPVEVPQLDFPVAVRFGVECQGTFFADGSEDSSLQVICTASENSTQSIVSLRYRLNGGEERTVNGATFTITDDLNSGGNRVTIIAVGSQGTELPISPLDFSAPIECEYSLEETSIVFSCSGGGDQVASYDYILNGGNPTETGFPITISRNLLTSSQTSILIIRLIREDTTVLGQAIFTFTPQTLNFRVSCIGRFVGNGVNSYLEVTCTSFQNSSQTIESLRYRLNGGSEVTVDDLSFIITGDRLVNGSTIDITAVGSLDTELNLQLGFPILIGCGYRIVGGQIVLSCSGGIQQVVRYEYVINDRETITGTVFPIAISVNNTSLEPTEINIIILRLYTSGNVLLSQTNFTFLLPQPAPRCEFGGVMYEVGQSFPQGDGCNTCSCINGARVVCTRIFCPQPLAVTCPGRSAVPGRATIDCISTNPNITVSCLFDGVNRRPCSFPLRFNFREFGFVPHTVNVTVTDSFGQTVDLYFEFRLARPLGFPRISISFPTEVSASEVVGSDANYPGARFRFRIQGTTIGQFRFSLVPLTYQQYQNLTGKSVQSVFGTNIPFPASRDDISVNGRANYAFGAVGGEVAENLTYNLTTAIVDDAEVEFDEGFILYIEINDNNNPSDNFDVEAQNRSILVTIDNDDGRVSVTFPLETSVVENATQKTFFFGVEGVWLDVFNFSLVPLTYQQFLFVSGQSSVSSVFPAGTVIPPAAGQNDILRANGTVEYSYSPNPQLPGLAGFITYELAAAVRDDASVEGDEGFILYVQYDENNNPRDTIVAGNRAILVTIEDNDGPVLPFKLECEAIDDAFFGGVRCTHTGAVGRVTFSCSYDNGTSEECTIPLVLNRIRFSLGQHTLLIVARDSRGSTSTFIYTFEGAKPPELSLTVTPRHLIVGEDGSASDNIMVTKEGYSFGQVGFSLVPLTYSEFVSEVGGNLQNLFPLRPITAALNSDFDGREWVSSFSSGLVKQPAYVVSGSGLALVDSLAEFTEGFVYYLKIDRDSLHQDDRDRLKVVNKIILVSIKNNNLPLTCSLTGDVLLSLTVRCDGTVPSTIITSTIQCRYDNRFIDCSSLPITIDTTSSSSGSHTVIISGSTATGDVLPVGEATFTVPPIDLTFINDTPLLEGGRVHAEFRADREGLEFYCHLTHLDAPLHRDNCSSGSYTRTGLPTGDFTLRVIAYDPVRGDQAVIRSRLWVHSTDPNDQFCIMYLRNRGWRVTGTTFSVDFTATGAASTSNNGQFECSLNRQNPAPCTAPLEYTDLTPGTAYHVRIRPASCGRNYRVWSKWFTVPEQ